MGDQFIEDMSNGVKNITVSRKRALQIIGGAMAVAAPARIAPAAEAGKQRKPPLAVASAVLVDIQPSSGDSLTWVFKGAVVHKESGDQARLDTSAGLALTTTAEEARKKIVAVVRLRAREALTAQRGLTVPDDRIAVILF